MIDLKKLREHPLEMGQAIQKKDPHFNLDLLREYDAQRRTLMLEIEVLRSQKNILAQQAKVGISQENREQSIRISHMLKSKEEELKSVEEKFQALYLECPNGADVTVPVGGKEENKVVKVVGSKPHFAFEPRNHVDIGTHLGWLDFQSGAHIAASQFVVYRSDAVRLMYALTMLMLKNNVKHGFEPILPPYMVNEESLIVTGNFPKFKDQVYALDGDALFVTPTAEVNLTNLFRNQIVGVDELPIRLTAWTSCFRKEAGGYGATERGLIRMHQFEKVELVVLCKPENSNQEQEKMVACAESILQALGLHYRISLLAGQDCSFASAKTYDIEVWLAGQKAYYEVSSVSNCTDFQARRGLIRYKDKEGRTQLVHTLNGSSLALSRIMVALIEMYQNADGSVTLPDIITKEFLF